MTGAPPRSTLDRASAASELDKRQAPPSLPILAAQRVDAQALARDAQERGWIDEAERHHKLIARLDALIANTGADTA